jgi:hypothetical protein
VCYLGLRIIVQHHEPHPGGIAETLQGPSNRPRCTAKPFRGYELVAAARRTVLRNTMDQGLVMLDAGDQLVQASESRKLHMLNPAG